VKNVSLTDPSSPVLKESIRVGGRIWELSLHLEPDTDDSVPCIVDIPKHQQELEQRYEEEVAQG
jgi:hypothetical protein